MPALESVLERAVREERILVTADKDFGEKVFRERRPHRGIVLLRLDDERAASRITVLRSLFERFADRLPDNFVVVTETRVRFAQNPI